MNVFRVNKEKKKLIKIKIIVLNQLLLNVKLSRDKFNDILVVIISRVIVIELIINSRF